METLAADGHRHACGSVLVVDDEPTIAEVVARYLERAGYQVRTAADGAGALKLLAESPTCWSWT